MIGTIFMKPVNDWETYAQTAEWCNAHNARIVEYSDCYMVESIPDKTFDELKMQKLNELETAFNTCVSGSFACSQGWPMQFDRSDTLAVEGAVQLLRATGAKAGYLTDANDATHYGVPLATMEAVKVEMLAAYAQCHARKQELRATINAAQTEEELDAIEITWPV